MDKKPLKSLYIHKRLRFLAITSIVIMLYIILTASSELSEFSNSFQFKMIPPWLVISALFYLMLRKRYVPCPYCGQSILMKKKWTCPSCKQVQKKERMLFDKCTNCKAIQTTSVCEHCKKEFSL